MPLLRRLRRACTLGIGCFAAALALSGCAQFEHVSAMTVATPPATPKSTPSETQAPATETPTAAPSATPSPTASVSTEVRHIDVYALRIGDCFNDVVSAGDIVEEVGLIDCAAPHEYELYAQVNLPHDVTLETLYDVADALCHGEFQKFTGAPWEASEYYYSYFTPSDESLAAREDMWVDCMIFHETELVEGSLRDSGYADWANPSADA